MTKCSVQLHLPRRSRCTMSRTCHGSQRARQSRAQVETFISTRISFTSAGVTGGRRARRVPLRRIAYGVCTCLSSVSNSLPTIFGAFFRPFSCHPVHRNGPQTIILTIPNDKIITHTHTKGTFAHFSAFSSCSLMSSRVDSSARLCISLISGVSSSSVFAFLLDFFDPDFFFGSSGTSTAASSETFLPTADSFVAPFFLPALVAGAVFFLVVFAAESST